MKLLKEEKLMKQELLEMICIHIIIKEEKRLYLEEENDYIGLFTEGYISYDEEDIEFEEFKNEVAINPAREESIIKNCEWCADFCDLSKSKLESVVKDILNQNDLEYNRYRNWYETSSHIKILDTHPLNNLIYLAKGIFEMSIIDFNMYMCNYTSYEIRRFEKIFAYETEDLSKIYNLNILNPDRRAAKELRRLNSLANILIVISYLILENLRFKKGHIKGIALILNKMISIPVPTLKVKISQIKNYVKIGNTKQLSEGLICAYLKFKDISLNKMLQILIEYQYFIDKNIEERFLRLLEDSTYLDGITTNNIEIFEHIMKMWPYYTEKDYDKTFLIGTYYDK